MATLALSAVELVVESKEEALTEVIRRRIEKHLAIIFSQARVTMGAVRIDDDMEGTAPAARVWRRGRVWSTIGMGMSEKKWK